MTRVIICDKNYHLPKGSHQKKNWKKAVSPLTDWDTIFPGQIRSFSPTKHSFGFFLTESPTQKPERGTQFIGIEMRLYIYMTNIEIDKKKEHSYLTRQVPQPLLLVVGWVYNTLKTAKFFFGSFQSFYLVTHCGKGIIIG